MEWSNSAKEALIQAQMLKLEGNGSTLCQEHILYGLIVIALEEDKSKSSYDESNTLWKYLMTKMISVKPMKELLRECVLGEGKSQMTDGRATLERTIGFAEDRPLSLMDLAQAVFEAPSPLIRQLCASLKEKKPQQAEQTVKPAAVSEDVVRAVPRPARPVPRPQSAPRPVQPRPIPQPAPAKPVQPPKPAPKPVQNKMSMDELLRMAHEMEEKQSVPQKAKAIKKTTKMGLITYRGGVAAAAIQYFLLGLLIPAAILFGVEHFTGYVTAPPTSLVTFCLYAFVFLCAFRMLRGLFMLIGLATKSFAFFLRLLSDLGIIALLSVTYKAIFALPDYPDWLKIAAPAIALIVLIIGAISFDALPYTPLQKRRSIQLGRDSGRVGKVLFKAITQQLASIVLVLGGLWSFGSRMPSWASGMLWIIAAVCLWNIPNTIIACLALWTSANWYHGGGRGFFRFLNVLWLGTFVPMLFLLVHQLFALGALRTWEWIVMGIYALSAFVFAIFYAKGE